MIYTLGSRRVTMEGRCFIAPDATLIGSVVLGADASVWFGVTIRADTEVITIGARSNVQDGSVLHADEGVPLTVGEGVTVGHRVMLHGCTIGDGCLVGIGSTVLNHAVIGAQSLVGAHALVTEGKEFPPRSLLLGSPARRVRELTEGELAKLEEAANHYVDNAARYLAQLAPDPRWNS